MECISCGVEMELLAPGIYQCPHCMQLIATSEKQVKEIDKKEFSQAPIIDSQEGITNKKKILKLLEHQNLTSNEIATKLNLSDQDARTYLLRLKNEDKIEVVAKDGRFYIYSQKNSQKNEETRQLENDLRFLINLLETKMTIRHGYKLKAMEKYLIDTIKNKISYEKNKIEKKSEIWNESIEYEQDISENVQERLNLLEARIDKLVSEIKETEIIKSSTNNDYVKCPVCGSASIKKTIDKSKIVSYSGETPIFAAHYVCKQCGYIF